jgi:hypothetical protein
MDSELQSSCLDSSKDALLDLLRMSSPHKCRMIKVSENVSYLTNGIAYSFVEVAYENGLQYGLQAYGKEPIELNKIALDNL